MSLLERIRRNRASIAEELGQRRYRDVSAAVASNIRITERLIANHARGRVLDVGCGHMPFRSIVLRHADSYEGLDIAPRVDGVRYVTDAVKMNGVPRNAFDTVLCSEVLEHVPAPDRTLAAIATVLRPGGKLIATVPHLSRLHEEPDDYYRYTGYGLRHLVEQAGFEVLALAPHAGLISFLGHQASTVLLGSVWSIPVLRDMAYHLNRFLLVYPALWLDSVIDRRSLFPLGYSVVARMPTRAGASTTQDKQLDGLS